MGLIRTRDKKEKKKNKKRKLKSRYHRIGDRANDSVDPFTTPYGQIILPISNRS